MASRIDFDNNSCFEHINAMRKMATSSTYKVFSYSAPFVTEQEERIAKESLSEADLQLIHNDLFGIRSRIITTSNNDDSCTMTWTSPLECSDREEGKMEVEADNNFDERISNSFETSRKESIDADGYERADKTLRGQLGHKLIRESLDQLPMELSNAYRIAIERNPSLLFISECNWDYYLYKYNNDVWAAAEAIAYYWTLRRTTFGDEKYHRYMTFEIEGCMYDIKNEFAYGGIRIDGYDIHGRPILYFDVKTVATMHRDIAAQIAFFWVHQLIYNRYQLPYVTAVGNNYNSISATFDTNAVDGGSSIDASGSNEPIFHDCIDSSNHNDNNTLSSVGDICATETLTPLPIDDLPTHPDFSYVGLGNFKGYVLSKHFDRKRSKKINQIMFLLPPCAWHLCVGYGTRTFFELVLPFYKALLPKGERGKGIASIVLHNGSNEEIVNSLGLYGIPKSCLDVSIGGTTNSSAFEQKILLNQKQHR